MLLLKSFLRILMIQESIITQKYIKIMYTLFINSIKMLVYNSYMYVKVNMPNSLQQLYQGRVVMGEVLVIYQVPALF